MQAFGCKNFRKFQNLPMMDLGGINIFVGTNNSGKSSFTRGLMLFAQNLNLKDWADVFCPPLKVFNFINLGGERLHLGSYNTCINEENADGEMAFSIINGNTTISVILAKPYEIPALSVPIKSVEITNKEVGAKLLYNFDEHKTNGGTVKIEIDIPQALSYYNEKRTLGILLESRISSFPYFDKIKKGQEFYDMLMLEKNPKFKEEKVESAFKEYDNIINILQNYKQKYFCIEECFQHTFHHTKQDSIESAIAKYLYFDIPNCIRKDLNLPIIHYVEAHMATHDSWINVEDKNNYLARTVVQYKTISDEKKVSDKEHYDIVHEFLLKHMRELDVCDNFRICFRNAEFFSIDVNDGKQTKDLSAKGTGSIQMFILLLRIACALLSCKEKKMVLIVEEPEMNMHPKMQSLLADLFYEAFNLSKGSLQFIVETHSEYLVRKTQVIVARKEYDTVLHMNENNPFLVYYFSPSDDTFPITKMKYELTGGFTESFGTGFYDEAAVLDMEIMRREFQNNPLKSVK